MLPKEKVDNLLAPYIPRINKCISESITDYTETYSNVSHIHGERTKATIIRDHIVYKIKHEFTEDEAVKFIDKKDGLFLLTIKDYNGRIALWFKKLDKELKGANINTKQVVLLQEQEIQLDIEGFEERPTIIVAGYQLNSIGTAAENIYFVCRKGKNVRWVEKLLNINDFTSNTSQTLIEHQELPLKIKQNIQETKDGTKD